MSVFNLEKLRISIIKSQTDSLTFGLTVYSISMRLIKVKKFRNSLSAANGEFQSLMATLE